LLFVREATSRNTGAPGPNYDPHELREQRVKSLLAALAAAFFSGGSWAGLGAAPGHWPTQVAAARSSTVSTGLGAYTVVQHQLDSGTLIQEFVDGSGTVFAVSWSGPFLPDLKELLGAHFDAMAAQGATQGAQHSRLAVQSSDAVIVSTGHMGAFEGRAWLPSRLPPGFDARAMP
jgi:hypothetical protein